MPSLSPRRLPAMCLLALLVASTAVSQAAPALDSRIVEVEAGGKFRVAGLSFGLVLYDADYLADEQDSLQQSAGFPKIAADRWETAGLWQPKKGGASFKVSQTIERLGDARFRVTYHVDSTTADAINVPLLLACQAMLPAGEYEAKTLLVDASALPLAPTGGKPVSFDKWGSQTLVIPTAQGNLTVEGDLKIHVQDDRPWNSPYFKMWFPVVVVQQPTHNADLSLTFTLAPAGK